MRKFIICISVDGQAVGNENGAGGRSRALDAAAAVAAATAEIVGGAGGGNERPADGKFVGLDSVADGEGERPFDDGQCGEIRCCC